MKRKVYQDDNDRKQDRWIGFVAFPTINVGLLIIELVLLVVNYQIGIGWNSQIVGLLNLLPWIVNGLILLWAFIFRPEFALGWIGFFCLLIVASVVLGILFVAGCFIIIVGITMAGVFVDSWSNCPAGLILLIIPLFGVSQKMRSWNGLDMFVVFLDKVFALANGKIKT